MYMEIATEEDKKMVEEWKADADGILIFVRLYPPSLCFTPTQYSMVIDWSLLRCCRNVDLGVHSGYPTESTGHLQLLPREYLSGDDQPQ